ncbi:CopG family transcriptional regulator [Leptolyngbya sp. NK1-12]|uniref:CopG family transcriptional regulator n=1 Tax=Leptolyngbya sp. NK1-12 TaxID=2547451 RepID=A0AA97ALJ8_9CYAN|nr:CopG family transcriptional regulator [Leptolyngbya sp. NK1-12]WNZ27571.1 CopG family transcriptional regulator [Leptolyngbya sp. NK1-12]
MKAEVFDQQFDQGETITEFLDISQARRPGHESRAVTIDFPQWMLDALDREARRLGVTRESIVKVWLAERLERVS